MPVSRSSDARDRRAARAYRRTSEILPLQPPPLDHRLDWTKSTYFSATSWEINLRLRRSCRRRHPLTLTSVAPGRIDAVGARDHGHHRQRRLALRGFKLPDRVLAKDTLLLVLALLLAGMMLRLASSRSCVDGISRQRTRSI